MELRQRIRFDTFTTSLTYYIAVIYFITRIVEYLTDTSNFWTNFWIKIVDLDHDHYRFKTYGMLIYTSLLYWIIGLLYIFMDITKKPKFLQKYKTQPIESAGVKKILSTVPLVLFNQVVLNTGITSYVGANENVLMAATSVYYTSSFPRLIFDIVCYQLMYDAIFYYMHRLFHHNKYLYKWFHKKHHEWTAPVAITAIYAHPVEHILANLIPVVAPLSILKLPTSTSWVAMSITTISTLGDHSGYHLPFLHSPQAHDFHHLRFTECYGFFSFWDKIHKTSEKFEQSIYFKRHKTLLTLKSANELYPSDEMKVNNEEEVKKNI